MPDHVIPPSPVSAKDRRNMPFGETREETLERHKQENAEVRQRLQWERAQQKAAETKARQEAHERAMAAQVAAIKEQARVNFPGSAQEFERAWPGLLTAWQQQQTLAATDRAKADAYARAWEISGNLL